MSGSAQPLLDPASATAVIEHLFDQGWSDGLPLVPATEPAVTAFLERTSRSPDEVVARIAALDRQATVRDVAVHAIMAGCRPEYFPVVLAAWDALSAERAARGGGFQSTSGPTPLIIVNGPIRDEIELNSRGGVIGPGFRPNGHIQPGVINQTLAPGQSIGIPLILKPLRKAAVEDIAPLRLAGTVQYQPADRAPIDLPIEQMVVIDREWPLLEGRSKIAVDGRLDDWPAGLTHRLVLPREVGNADDWHGPDDASLAFEVRRDDEFVHIGAAVRDDRVVVSDQPGEGDYVELWIDGRPRDDRRLDGNWQKALNERQVLRIEVGPGGDGSVQVRNAADLPEGARAIGTSGEDGWTIEIAIPVGYFITRQGEDWSGARINVLLKDTDQVGQRPATLAWMPDWRWRRNIPGSGTFVRDANHGH